MYGLENSGIGRYIMNLVYELKTLDISNNYVILLREKYYKSLHFPGNWRKVLADFRHYTLTEQFNLPKIINKEKPDLVHFPHFNVPFFYQGKFVVTVHDMTMHFQGRNATTLPTMSYLAKRIPYKIIFRNSVKKAVKIIAPSMTVRGEIKDYFKINRDKIAVTYEGLDSVYKSTLTPNLNINSFELGNRYFVYTGNAYPHKNLENLIDATSYLNRHMGLSVNLVIIGSRTVFLEKLKFYIEKTGANNYVKLLGYIQDEYLKLIYRNSVAFVFPSLAEGFGLPGIEAMASGTLVLASDIPVFKEIYKDNVLYFNPHDYRSIAKTMKDVMKIKESERKIIIQKSKIFIQRYSWRNMAKETLKIYESSNSI
ncbi:MAG TPA: glycosyltransferase family 1 protein [Candidatus Humimicrobiaceae bacterium]|nr:glycosyltransferase family 1 protein [Candidatus Humimicrobiaceae bacterium]